LIGKIIDDDPLRGFGGYHGNAKATDSKVMRDVFVKGDKYFRSGDLLRRDASGYWYFVDRIGDTFRWKGENVSTNEVAEVLSLFPNVKEVNVYGAAVPNTDGRACMVGMVFDQNANEKFFSEFYIHATTKLPAYAVPVFIRKLQEVEITSTFKHQKVKLRKEGADPSLVPADEPLYMIDTKAKTYVPLTPALWQSVIKGQSKL
jgi:acyl-CoA synthetase (AMP-forming)/AMP-acid ligase II